MSSRPIGLKINFDENPRLPDFVQVGDITEIFVRPNVFASRNYNNGCGAMNAFTIDDLIKIPRLDMFTKLSPEEKKKVLTIDQYYLHSDEHREFFNRAKREAGFTTIPNVMLGYVDSVIDDNLMTKQNKSHLVLNPFVYFQKGLFTRPETDSAPYNGIHFPNTTIAGLKVYGHRNLTYRF